MLSKSIRRRVSAICSVTAGMLLVQPVAAQTGIDLFRQGFCGTRVASMVGAVWIGGVFFLGAYAIYRVVHGLKQMSAPDSSTKIEGRQEVKGSFYAFLGTALLLSAERVLAWIGVTSLDCLNLALP